MKAVLHSSLGGTSLTNQVSQIQMLIHSQSLAMAKYLTQTLFVLNIQVKHPNTLVTLQHNKEDLAAAVKLCRQNKIAVMIDLLLGGPGETPQTARETIDYIKKINPDCAGAALGIRVYPGTAMEQIVAEELRNPTNGNIHRKYSGPINLLKPTFYISEALGEHPAELVRDLIAGDRRFFEPAVETFDQATENGDAANYNYNENLLLTEAIREGARGAYWDILRRLRNR